jgi:hypothetical protein
MAEATNKVFTDFASSWAMQPFNKGWARKCGRATLPTGQTTCTISKVPNLTPQTIIMIQQQGAYGATAPLIEISASRLNASVGRFLVGTADGSAVTSDAVFSFQYINP